MQETPLNGRHECSLDDRSRLAIPAKFRWAYSQGAVIARWFDDCMVIIPRERWADTLANVFGDDVNVLNDNERRLRRFLIGQMSEQELDKQGRVAIPQQMRQRFGLGGKVAVLGAGSYLEVWNPATLDQEFEEMDAEGVSNIGRRLVEDGR